MNSVPLCHRIDTEHQQFFTTYMCGISGVLNFDRKPVSRETLEAMIGTLSHRGPDAAGVLLNREIGLAHARLSIIDLVGGSQPMHNADSSLWITFNGEIFNYPELRAELEAKGHRFATHSDTEVLLQLYEEEGERCLEKLNGQWSFAIWDSRTHKLFIARDRLGVRPFFYINTGRAFVFASEIKALLAHPEVPRELDAHGLNQVFTFWVTIPPRTMFKGICELPPAHCLTVQHGHLRVRRYWDLKYNPDSGSTAPQSATQRSADQLLELLQDATRIRLRSDVPVGAYLSGGLDSSIVTALILRSTDAPLRTFSVTFENSAFDECPYQQEVVSFLGTEHQAIRCTNIDIAQAFPKVVWHAETALLRTAPAPLYLLSGLVRRERFKVVLTGEGSDEMLGGYDIFKEAKIRRFIGRQPNSQRRPLLLQRLYPYMENLQKQSAAYLKAFFRVDPTGIDNRFFSHLPRWTLTSRLKTFFSGSIQNQLQGVDVYDELEATLPRDFDSWDSFTRAQYLESAYLLPGYILSSQGDRVAMANSLEARFPFLDYRIAEFCATLPATLKMKVLNEKYLLKRCASHLVPASIIKRSKQPYRAPGGECFVGPTVPDYVDDLLSPRKLQNSDIFNPTAVQKLLDKFRQGHALGTKDDMALIGILSTQLLEDQFLRSFKNARQSNASDHMQTTAVHCG